ncbi:MAG: asparagine synthase (glutamine-hydrolyzing) [Bacteroidia bacterium]|nr:asparagine synthase (glutamine-hydrolyzing) [Bacteroidia bacterium]
MCGISGMYGLRLPDDAAHRLEQMNDSIAHRGPDDQGTLTGEEVLLGHRRLAILDLSPAGHQPMHDQHQRLSIVFNGEIFNFQEIREELSEYPFKTQSDTEVILAAYLKWGKECLHRFNGMFALAIWDREQKELFIARDRLGIKPLYYHFQNGLLLFCSEIRGLLNSGLVERSINRDAVEEYFSYQTVHAPNTLVKDVFMLMPGHHLTARRGEITIRRWWSPRENFSRASEGKSYKEVCGDVYDLLQASVKRRLISDVPFGAFLSGGIDSSAVVGLMSRMQSQKVKTFTIVFDEEEFSEARYARMIAERFGTDHHEFRLGPEDFLRELPEALSSLDHPSGDGPNSYTVSKITRKAGITMALSGLGGDELFAGYPVFNRSLQLQQQAWLYSIPRFLRQMAGSAYMNVKKDTSAAKAAQVLGLADGSLRNTFPLSRQVGLPGYVRALLRTPPSGRDAIRHILDTELQDGGKALPLLSQVSVAEITTYMQNVLLRDTDQMSMAVALEVRVPFLDYKLVEYVLGISDAFKKPLFPKKLLVDSLGDLLPDEVVHRKKMGFVFPWALWLKKELRPLCDEHIRHLAKRDFIQGDYLLNSWTRFQKGDKQVRWLDMWLATVLENWMEKNRINS